MRASLIAATALLALVGCSEKKQKAEKQPPPKLADARPPVDAAAPPPDRAALVAQVRELLDSWKKAQNEGQFSAYAGHYAKSFRGVKRTASGKATKMDRDGWLADREAMFARGKMTVDWENVRVAAWFDDKSKLPANHVSATFTQRWKSARYADHGTKQLTLRWSPNALEIVYEDMLSAKQGFYSAPTITGISTAKWAELEELGWRHDMESKMASLDDRELGAVASSDRCDLAGVALDLLDRRDKPVTDEPTGDASETARRLCAAANSEDVSVTSFVGEKAELSNVEGCGSKPTEVDPSDADSMMYDLGTGGYSCKEQPDKSWSCAAHGQARYCSFTLRRGGDGKFRLTEAACEDTVCS